MASKYQLINGVYESTIQEVRSSPAAWTAFLRSACRNYKCRFDEQILIYAQRPDATAVLEIEKWNERFGRWVNKGAKGIAVFDDEHNGNYRLKHYFDVSDTHGSRFERPVPLWQMRPEYEAEVVESIENSYGELDDKSTLAAALISAAKNAVEDNVSDYLADLMNSLDGSVLEQLADELTEREYRSAVHNSVAYMMLTRCGIDADKYFPDFRPITNFNTRNTVNALGLAASDIAEMCLREISATIIALQRERAGGEWVQRHAGRTVAKPEKPAHTVTIPQNNERGAEHGTDVSRGRRLPNPESDRAGGRGGSRQTGLWQVCVTPKEIPQTAPPRPVPEPADGGDAERTPDGDRADGQQSDGTADRADGGGTRRDGAVEINQPDEMGRADEQHPAGRGGNDTARPDLRIKALPTQEEQLTELGEAEEKATGESPAPVPPAISLSGDIPQEVIDAHLIRYGRGGIFQPRFRIYHTIRQFNSENEAIKFLKGEFGISGGQSWADSAYRLERSGRGLTFKKGGISGEVTYTLSWKNAVKRIRELIAADRYLTPQEIEQLYPQYLEYC